MPVVSRGTDRTSVQNHKRSLGREAVRTRSVVIDTNGRQALELYRTATRSLPYMGARVTWPGWAASRSLRTGALSARK